MSLSELTTYQCSSSSTNRLLGVYVWAITAITILLSVSSRVNANPQNKLTQFFVVEPRTLEVNENVLSFEYSTDKDAINFKIKIIKPEEYVYRAQENDNVFENEHIRIYIIPNSNSRNAYVFGINHQNVYFDGIYNDSAGLTLDWDGQWDYQVQTSENHWEVTGKIPWRNFPFKSHSSLQRVQFLVSKHGNNAQKIISSAPSYTNYTSFFDNLKSIDVKIPKISNVEIFPYYSLNHSLLIDKTQHNFGGDIFWQRSQNEYIDITIHPDFGQVESNELVVNFSAIEQFFNEQRPFFTRNQTLFDVSGSESLFLVHTPRIGGASVYEDVESRDIIAATRYSISGNDASYSILLASEENNDIAFGRDFAATRAKFNTDSGTLGLSANFVNTPSLNRQSKVLGVDYFLSISDNFEISLGGVESLVQHSNDTNGYGFWLQSSYEKNDVHLHEFNFFVYEPSLDINDIGYVKRVNRKQLEYEYSFLIPKINSSFIKNMIISTEIEAKTNFDNENLPFQLGLSSQLSIENDASIELGFEWLTAGKDDNLTRDYYSTLLDRSWSAEVVYESKEYEFGQFEGELVFGLENWSGRFHVVELALKTNIFDEIYSEIALSQYQSESWLNWAEENFVDEFKFDEIALDLRMNYRFLESHEVRLRFELVAGDAVGISNNLIDRTGHRQALNKPDNFAFSEAAFQFRYKYSLTKLTAIFFSYTFGGEFEDEENTYSRSRLFSNAIKQKTTIVYFLKHVSHFDNNISFKLSPSRGNLPKTNQSLYLV
ncbi:DUF5916 domain-containing protein [Paraglaciecola polaris]|uniref:DUF5916 domain-containing protein n=2 Tax=Paraglaciecola polaris TaxID=222814 RepID=UPI0030DC3E6F|tara:strand:- start:1708 stop:4020 length:2313 start_codon:yes stop_codon:yes gene_type:complete